ncbi:NAD(P)/FAD-dependent oxidoreductase [Taibaiella koreensis]|uniref:NAD(P)/FAD-dependent oxidoreductase n=1 Tax=Taibaiella koreensis TaxID=1268548 RepID=UPI000E59E5E0|nr:FAD-binding oxidoreductase [Taibaiella koreensis]
MKVDFLIVGQGVAGTLLSYQLLKARRSLLVLDEGFGGKASRVAGAVMNPLSGKQWKPAPGADLFLPEALATYRELEQLLRRSLVQAMPLYLFQESGAAVLPQLQPVSPQLLDTFFHIPGRLDRLPDTWLVDAAALLDGWTDYLQEKGAFRRERFDAAQCMVLPDRVHYRDIEAGTIIFCEGAAARDNPLLQGLPFTTNRGEALLLDIPGLPSDALYHKGLRLAPRSDGLFWCGSNYTWELKGMRPDKDWRGNTLAALGEWLKLPFRLEDHIVAERPTTAGQVPLLGLHPRYPAVALFNGLGTRGFSAGPFWATQLAHQLLDPGYKIPALAGYARLDKWLR